MNIFSLNSGVKYWLDISFVKFTQENRKIKTDNQSFCPLKRAVQDIIKNSCEKCS